MQPNTIVNDLRSTIVRRVEAAGSNEILSIVGALFAEEQPIEFPPKPAAAPAVSGARFEVVGDVVRDHQTGLEWTRKNVSKERLSWDDAKAACEKLGNGWRMPEIRELLSLVDYERKEPAIDTSVFECDSAWYWSATNYAPVSGCAWVVLFGHGNSYGGNRLHGGFVRAVRGGQF